MASRDADCYADFHAHTPTDCHAYSHADAHAHADDYANGNSNADANSNHHGDHDADCNIEPMTLFRSLANRSFAFLWAGQTISRLGDSLYRIALAWWVLEKTGSATTMGTVLIFSFAPMLIFLLTPRLFLRSF